MYEIQRYTPNSDGFIRRVSNNLLEFIIIVIDRDGCVHKNQYQSGTANVEIIV